MCRASSLEGDIDERRGESLFYQDINVELSLAPLSDRAAANNPSISALSLSFLYKEGSLSPFNLVTRAL